MSELVKQLKLKKVFKLVCGAGNEDLAEIEKLSAIYSLAGCNFFDISANLDVLKAAKKGIIKANANADISSYSFCVSFGIKGDPHVSKARLDKGKCQQCMRCIYECPQRAVSNDFIVNTEKCIGCGKCNRVCKFSAIEMYSSPKAIEEVLPALLNEGVQCIELHSSSPDTSDFIVKWNCLNSYFSGPLSLCIDREHLSNKVFIERVKLAVADREDWSTIIQADGIPMSGCDDEYKTTLQAIAAAELVQDSQLPVYLLLSGGTNSKTAKFAKMCNIKAHGVAIGSYARKIVKEYTSRDDFWQNKAVFASAVERAKNLVDVSLKYLG